MNQPLLLHIVERLEGLLTRLPATIQKPILSELTPLKELFLQQRPPRLLFVGAANKPAHELLEILFGAPDSTEEVLHWQEANVCWRGTIAFLDARGAAANEKRIREELKSQDADFVLFVHDGHGARRARKAESENLTAILSWTSARVIGLLFLSPKSAHSVETEVEELADYLRATLRDEKRLIDVIELGPTASYPAQSKQLMSALSRELPNAARIEMIRISHDREAQKDVAQILVKSTTAICAAIGAQPIPLADLPILTTLQLVMVSGIMYVSGRERSLRAATEFIAALGANVGAGMVLREGARALLKFVPGWGNIICGMIAGAGTYAIGRAATAFFLEGVSLKQARQTYLKSRRKRQRLALPDGRPGKGHRHSSK